MKFQVGSQTMEQLFKRMEGQTDGLLSPFIRRCFSLTLPPLFSSRALLASFSPYFQRMFTSPFKESWEREIVLRDLSATCLQSLLDYAYTGILPFTAEDAEVLFTVASRLQIGPALEIISR